LPLPNACWAGDDLTGHIGFHPTGVIRKNGTWILECGTPKLLLKNLSGKLNMKFTLDSYFSISTGCTNKKQSLQKNCIFSLQLQQIFKQTYTFYRGVFKPYNYAANLLTVFGWIEKLQEFKH